MWKAMWFAFIVMLGAADCAAATVTACAEPSSGPPWLYITKDAQGKLTGELAGFTADLARSAFAKLGMQIAFRGDLPLIRCLELVAAGRIDFAIGPYYDAGRAKQFTYSTPYYTLTPQIFYSARRPIVFASVQDLSKYRGCGRHGWSYAHYGLHDNTIDKGTSTYRALVMKLKAGRCDYFPEELEVMASQILGKDSYLRDPELLHLPVKGAVAPSKHVIAARNSEAAKLLPRLNAAFDAMAKSGETDALWRKNAAGVEF